MKISTGEEHNNTSYKQSIANNVANNMNPQANKWVPFTPIFLPNNPVIIPLKKGNNNKERSL